MPLLFLLLLLLCAVSLSLDKAVCAVDLQLQTPFGAVALREWAGASRRVLLKTVSGAHLVIDPWQAVA